MDSTVRELIGRLDERLGQMSGQLDELHASVRQVVAVAEADPEMALTKARKVLEGVLRRVWEHFIPNEPIGTRPLEEVLQRLQKNGYLPRKQAAYAVAVKELGNVGTHVHDERIDKADVAQALSPLISVLEWYFEQDWAVGAAPKGPIPSPPPAEADPAVAEAPRRSRVPWPMAIAASLLGLVALVAVVLAVRGGGGETKATPAPEPAPAIASHTGPATTEQVVQALQGEWTVISHEVNGKIEDQDHLTKSDHRFRFEKTMWTHTFRRPDRPDLGLTTVGGRFVVDAATGHIDLDGARLTSSENRQGTPGEIRGIFEFQGDRLRLCYKFGPDLGRGMARPTNFNTSLPPRRPGPQQVVFHSYILKRASDGSIGRADPATGAGGESPPSPAAPAPKAPAAPAVAKRPGPATTAEVIKALQGEWVATSHEAGGKVETEDDVIKRDHHFIFINNDLIHTSIRRQSTGGRATLRGRYVLDAATGHIDLVGARHFTPEHEQGVPAELRGIFELRGDQLRLCYKFGFETGPGMARPTNFDTVPIPTRSPEASPIAFHSFILKRVPGK